MGQDEKLKIRKSLDSAYQKILKWKKNYMRIPRGKAGKTLIAEVTRLIRLLNSSKRWESAAMHMIQVLLPLILQKPSPKSKNKTCQMPEQKNGMVETRKDRRTDLRV